MKYPLASLAAILVYFIAAPVSQAAQPRVTITENHLRSALGHLVKSEHEAPKKHVADALKDLEIASQSMEMAAKNKGSHRAAAIAKIEEAKKLMTGLQLTTDQREKAIALVKDAMTEAAEARRAGR
jgi:hypothetical protein